MKEIMKLLSAIVLLSSAGCVNKPPPSTLALWEKLGVNKSVVYKYCQNVVGNQSTLLLKIWIRARVNLQQFMSV